MFSDFTLLYCLVFVLICWFFYQLTRNASVEERGLDLKQAVEQAVEQANTKPKVLTAKIIGGHCSHCGNNPFLATCGGRRPNYCVSTTNESEGCGAKFV